MTDREIDIARSDSQVPEIAEVRCAFIPVRPEAAEELIGRSGALRAKIVAPMLAVLADGVLRSDDGFFADHPAQVAHGPRPAVAKL